MTFRTFILGLFLIQCIVYSQDAGGCAIFADPNDYIDDPNTLENGLFECGDPNNQTPYGTFYDFVPPIYWERIPHLENTNQDDCYAGLHEEFTGKPRDGEWRIAHPYSGNFFLLLSTGGDGGALRDEQVKGSSVSQNVYLSQGDTIIGAYFFGTTDYMPYNDYGQISLVLAGDPNDYPNSLASFIIPESYCDVDMVGNYQSTEPGHPESDFSATTDGWVPFSYTISEPNLVGPYRIVCEVVDFNDRVFNSYYAVDGLRICRGGKPLSDLNSDCEVNLIDYSILSEAWLSFCPDDPNGIDPNDIADPNIPCQLADIDNSWFVDPNDLATMSFEWLEGTDPNNL
jgi:hypothetical protein